MQPSIVVRNEQEWAGGDVGESSKENIDEPLRDGVVSKNNRQKNGSEAKGGGGVRGKGV